MAQHSHAGKPARLEDLTNIPRLMAAYYLNKPDMSKAEQRVAFGTSGHRGSSLNSAFTESQLLRGVGTILGFVFLNQAAIASVRPEEAGDAAGLFSAARNIGGSFALAGIATLQDQRSYLHSRRIEETLNANSVAVQDYLAGMSHALGSTEAAFQSLAGTIQQQAFVMAYNDVFWSMALATFATLPLVFFLRPLPKGLSLSMH